MADNSGFTGPISITLGAINVRNSNALGSTTRGTTVLAGGQLQVENTPGVAEPVFLNGAGSQNDGALLNVAGDSIWTGPIQLDSNSTLGSLSGTLTIQSVISDFGTATISPRKVRPRSSSIPWERPRATPTAAERLSTPAS